MAVLPRIPVAQPRLGPKEREYVLDCLDSGWISSQGAYIQRFEKACADRFGAPHAVSVMNGTAALHLALLALGVGPGDEVIVPTLTYIATANAVRYCGATPVLAESDARTWNIDPTDIERRITLRTKGIIPVHLYGAPADMDAINAIAKRHGLWVLEDAAEAHGATVHGKPVGGLSTVGMLSFYGNKLVTTGEGGMLLTHDPALADQMRLLRGQGMDPQRRYWFPVVGYNFRMTNIQAAIGCGQMEGIEGHITARQEIAAWYAAELGRDPSFTPQEVVPGTVSAHWMVSVLLEGATMQQRDQVLKAMDAQGIETRPLFHPLHTMPPYAGAGPFPIAERLGASGLNLPTWSGMTKTDVARVCAALRAAWPVVRAAVAR